LLPQSWDGPALLTWREETGDLHEEAWERLGTRGPRWSSSSRRPSRFWPCRRKKRAAATPLLTWQDAVRGLELDDAARRSVEKRRSSLMEYQEANEEVGFKGTMTLNWLSRRLAVAAGAAGDETDPDDWLGRVARRPRHLHSAH